MKTSLSTLIIFLRKLSSQQETFFESIEYTFIHDFISSAGNKPQKYINTIVYAMK